VGRQTEPGSTRKNARKEFNFVCHGASDSSSKGGARLKKARLHDCEQKAKKREKKP